MTKANEEAGAEDRLGVFMALMQHMREGKCCDELANEHLFGKQLLRMVGSAQLAVDEVFCGDNDSFMKILFMKIALLSMAGKVGAEILIEIERWLNERLTKAADLYFNETLQ